MQHDNFVLYEVILSPNRDDLALLSIAGIRYRRIVSMETNGDKERAALTKPGMNSTIPHGQF